MADIREEFDFRGIQFPQFGLLGFLYSHSLFLQMSLPYMSSEHKGNNGYKQNVDTESFARQPKWWGDCQFDATYGGFFPFSGHLHL